MRKTFIALILFVLWVPGIAAQTDYTKPQEDTEKTKAEDEAELAELAKCIHPDDTTATSISNICRYLGKYQALHPDKHLPLTQEAAQLKELREFTANQDVRNKVSDSLMQILFFYMYFGMSPSSPEFKDFYEQYLITNTGNQHREFVTQQLALIAKSAPGQKAIDFAVMDTKGIEHRFTDLVGNGKVAYIDFWATWCGPCVKEIPYMEQLVEQFKDNDRVRFISISIDTNTKQWKQKVAADKPQWEQYNISEPDKSEGVAGYSITSIPRFMLFDAEGLLYKSSAPRPSQAEAAAMIQSLLK